MSYVEQNVADRILASNATFQAWVLAVRTGITGAGITRTGDTGQIDPTTVAMPAINTLAGYDIFRFNDSEQGSSPIFFKLQYGIGTAVTRHLFQVQVGTGSDGAGNITGGHTALPITATAPSPTAGAGTVIVSYFDGHLTVMDTWGLTGNIIAFAIERLRHAHNGNYTGDILVGTATGTNSAAGPTSIASRLLSGGTWTSPSVNDTDAILATIVYGNRMRVGGFTFLLRPTKLLRCWFLLPQTLGLGDTGSVDDGSDVIGLKKPTPVDLLGVNSAGGAPQSLGFRNS